MAKNVKGAKEQGGSKNESTAASSDFRCFIIDGKPDKRTKCYKNPTTGRYDWNCEEVDADECVHH